ncbi:hypothetical protein OFC62_40530, partial [Escherichia coli]|nr:hypothetical protein [Escherichia coli]
GVPMPFDSLSEFLRIGLGSNFAAWYIAKSSEASVKRGGLVVVDSFSSTSGIETLLLSKSFKLIVWTVSLPLK